MKNSCTPIGRLSRLFKTGNIQIYQLSWVNLFMCILGQMNKSFPKVNIDPRNLPIQGLILSLVIGSLHCKCYILERPKLESNLEWTPHWNWILQDFIPRKEGGKKNWKKRKDKRKEKKKKEKVVKEDWVHCLTQIGGYFTFWILKPTDVFQLPTMNKNI